MVQLVWPSRFAAARLAFSCRARLGPTNSTRSKRPQSTRPTTTTPDDGRPPEAPGAVTAPIKRDQGKMTGALDVARPQGSTLSANPPAAAASRPSEQTTVKRNPGQSTGRLDTFKCRAATAGCTLAGLIAHCRADPQPTSLDAADRCGFDPSPLLQTWPLESLEVSKTCRPPRRRRVTFSL